MIRALKGGQAGHGVRATYPPDSVGILRAVNEIGVGDNVKIFAAAWWAASSPRTWVHGLAPERRHQLQQLAARAEHVLRRHEGVLRQVHAAPSKRRSIRSATTWRRSATRLGNCSRPQSMPPRVSTRRRWPSTCTRTSTRPLSGRSPSRRTESARSPPRCRHSTGRRRQEPRPVQDRGQAGDPVPGQPEDGRVIVPFGRQESRSAFLSRPVALNRQRIGTRDRLQPKRRPSTLPF